MLRKLLTLSLFIALFVSCETEPEKDFSLFVSDFVKSYAALFPDETPLSIDNENLATLSIPTDGYLDSVRQFHQRFTNELISYSPKDPNFSHKSDAAKMGKILKNVKAYIDDYAHNPQIFNVLHGFRRILSADYASDEYRLQTLFNKLAHVPAYYEAAKMQIHDPKLTTADAAVEQHLQTFLFFDETMTTMLKTRKQLTPQYAARIDAAKLAIKDYVAWVESYRVL